MQVESNIQYWYFALGFLAQALFSIRMIIQWLLSEKAKKNVSPVIYWQLSLLASLLLSLYGWLRGDFVIILGQFFSYYIYIWNLNIQGNWRRIHKIMRYIIVIIPIMALLFAVYDHDDSIERLFSFRRVPFGLMLFGSVGQIIFTFRFVYQWLYSRSRGESLLPVNFWLLSLIGSFITIIYALYRREPVLLLGQGVGFVAYLRNFWIGIKHKE